MEIIELTQQLTDNHILVNMDLPVEYKNQKVKIIILPFNDVYPLKLVEKIQKKKKKKELIFMNIKGGNLENETFSREEMYDDWGR